MSELRMHIEPRLFRVIDLAVYRDSRPEGRYAKKPGVRGHRDRLTR